MKSNGGKNMKWTDPYVLGGLAAILVGLLIYFFLPAYAFTVYGLPMTTLVLVIVGLVLIYMKMKK